MRGRAVIVTAVAVLVLSGCTEGTEPSPTASAPTGAVAPTEEPWTAERLSAALLGEGTPEDLAEVVATTSGTVTSDGVSHEVEVQLTSLEATERVTTLRYLLRVTDGSTILSPGTVWSARDGIWDTRAITIDDEAGGGKFQPYTAWTLLGDSGQPLNDSSCACSQFPALLDQRAVPMSAVFPPLSEGVDETVVEIPGLEPVSVPVTWVEG